MNFSQALENMKNGALVYRECWDLGVFAGLSTGEHPAIFIKDPNGNVTTSRWKPATSSLLSDDWRIAPASPTPAPEDLPVERRTSTYSADGGYLSVTVVDGPADCVVHLSVSNDAHQLRDITMTEEQIRHLARCVPFLFCERE